MIKPYQLSIFTGKSSNMKRKFPLSLPGTGALCCLVLISCTEANKAADRMADRHAITTVIDNSISWFKTKDFDLLFSTLVGDSTLFMYQPTSDATVRGIDQFRGYADIWNDTANRYVSHEIRDLQIHIGPSGDVAWFSADLDDCGEYHGKLGCWKNTRWTGVLEKRQGKWVIVQMHFSFAADQVADRVKKKLLSERMGNPPN